MSKADGEGFDTTAQSQEKQGCRKKGEAKAEAFLANLPPELLVIMAAWDKLPDAVKAGIMAMVQALALTEGKPNRTKANRKRPKRKK
jgi:hypothetical protein